MPESTDLPVPPKPPSPAADAVNPLPVKRKRRRWPIVVLAFLLLIVLLGLLAPTIASTSAVRRFVIGKINQNLNGTVDIQDWSLAWTGGLDVRGVRVFDDRNAAILSIAHVHTGISLLDAIRGRYHCGDTLVEEPNLEQFIIYKDGTNNLQKLVKETGTKSGSSSGERKSGGTPDLSGNFIVSRMRAMVINQRDNQQFILQPDSKLDVKVKSLNDPIENDIALFYKIGAIGSGEGAAGSVKLAGTALLGAGGADPTGSSVSEKIALDYDLEKLLAVIGPMLPPGVQENLKDIKIAGKATREFQVRGTYPIDKPFSEAVQSVTAYGSLAIDRVETQGVTVTKAEIPVSLVGGVVSTTIFGKSEKENLPPMAECNGGKINFGGLSVDLRGKEPRFSTPKDFKFLVAVSINPALGDKYGKYINPVATNAKRAQGLLDVTIAYCDRVALGEGLKTKDSGSAKILLSLREMDIANPIGSLMAGGLLKSIPPQLVSVIGQGKGWNLTALTNEPDTFRGQIRQGEIVLAEGQTTQDVTLELADASASSNAAKLIPLQFKGTIRLADFQQNLSVVFPSQLFARFIPDRDIANGLVGFVPNGFPISVRGTTSAPKFDFSKAFDVQEIAKHAGAFVAKSQLEKLTGGNKGDKKDNPIGGLIDSIAGDKKNKLPITIPGLEPKPEPQPQHPAPEPAPTRRRRTRGTTQPSTQPADSQPPAASAPVQPAEPK